MEVKESGIAKQIDLILREIEELKAIFILGQRVLPFLEELFGFVKEIGPMLNEINKSLEESSKKIPRASNQLTTVTKTTEMATTEILDALDEMSLKFGEIKGFITAMKNCYEKQKKLAQKINRCLKNEEFGKIHELWGRFYETFKNCNGFDDVLIKLADVKQSADNIMIALQFQDITAQQISAITYLIESVQERLTHLLENLEDKKLKNSETKIFDSRDESFNPMAQYDRSELKQKIVDEVIEENGNIASQEEIDKIFSHGKNAS